MSNLKSLTVTDCGSRVKQKHFIQTLKYLPDLEHLNFSKCGPSVEYPDYSILFAISSPVEISSKLISLDFHENIFVSDVMLKDVADKCVNLETLVISGCHNVTNEGIRMLVKLPHLKHLNLKYIDDTSIMQDTVTDHHLEMFADRRKLVKLEVQESYKITDEGCIKILSFCEELEHFDVAGCLFITDATVLKADEVVKCRTNDRKLKLLVGGTSVSKRGKWKDVTPLLELDFDYIYNLDFLYSWNYDTSERGCFA